MAQILSRAEAPGESEPARALEEGIVAVGLRDSRSLCRHGFLDWSRLDFYKIIFLFERFLPRKLQNALQGCACAKIGVPRMPHGANTQ